MNTEAKAAASQLLESITSTRTQLKERLDNWESLTRSALVSSQWVICTPDAIASYKLTKIRELAGGQAEYSSEICPLANAPLYAQGVAEQVLKLQLQLRKGQKLVMMHIRDAILAKLRMLDAQLEGIKEAMAT